MCTVSLQTWSVVKCLKYTLSKWISVIRIGELSQETWLWCLILKDLAKGSSSSLSVSVKLELLLGKDQGNGYFLFMWCHLHCHKYDQAHTITLWYLICIFCLHIKLLYMFNIFWQDDIQPAVHLYSSSEMVLSTPQWYKWLCWVSQATALNRMVMPVLATLISSCGQQRVKG